MTSIETSRSIVQIAVDDIEELDTGWIFTFNDTNISENLQKFVNHEQQCCTFLDFKIIDEVDQLRCKVTKKDNFESDIETVKEIIITLFSS